MTRKFYVAKYFAIWWFSFTEVREKNEMVQMSVITQVVVADTFLSAFTPFLI